MWFGEKYYIGSAVDINSRISLHFKSITGCFNGYGIGNNSQTVIMRHLIRNPSITEGLVEILSFVKSEYDLVNEENKFLSAAYLDPNCLNYSNNTTRKIKGVIVRPE